MMDKTDIALIMATKGFLYEGSIKEGYNVYHPYKEKGLLFRLLREFVFRVIPIFDVLFYSKSIINKNVQFKEILIWDPLITKTYIRWINKKFPNAKLHFIYWNMVGKATHLLPSEVPGICTKWTYDDFDSQKYGLKLYHSYPYFKTFIRQHKEDKYDVLFVGKDKGRADFLLEFEQSLKNAGLRTKFIITAESIFSKKKKFYQKEIKYDELCELISVSRSVLNIIMKNQKGLTLRDLEYVFQKVKLITNNSAIVNNHIYNKNNVFVIDQPSAEGIKEFLNLTYEPLSENVVNAHRFDAFVQEITTD